MSVPEVEELIEEDGIIGRRSLLRLLDRAAKVLLANDPNRIFTVGGTCACELAPVAFLNEKYDGDLALFWFDAHADLNTPATSHEPSAPRDAASRAPGPRRFVDIAADENGPQPHSGGSGGRAGP